MARGMTETAKQQVRNSIFRLLRRGKFLLGNDPIFLPLFLRLTPLGISRAITASTDLVIEGFPRCGNTFAVTAVEYASEHRIRVASHVHHPAQVKQAYRRGVPVLIVIREPVDALASYLTYGEHGRPASAIAEYCSYYRELLPYLDGVVISDFSVNVSNLSETIERLNERFGLAIPPFDQTPENVELVFDEISRFHKLTHRNLDASSVAPRPNPERQGTADQLREELSSPRYEELMTQARELHDYYLLKAEEQRVAFQRAEQTSNGNKQNDAAGSRNHELTRARRGASSH